MLNDISNRSGSRASRNESFEKVPINEEIFDNSIPKLIDQKTNQSKLKEFYREYNELANRNILKNSVAG